MGGMVARQLPLRAPERVDALVMMDTSAGPIPGFDPALMEAAAEVAFTQGKEALKELLDMVAVLETPAYQRTLADRPGYREFKERKWDDLSEVMWGAMAVALANQPDDLAALAAAVQFPMLVLVGEQDTPFVIASRAMTAAIDRARARGRSPTPGTRRSSRIPTAWIEATRRGSSASVPAPAK